MSSASFLIARFLEGSLDGAQSLYFIEEALRPATAKTYERRTGIRKTRPSAY